MQDALLDCNYEWRPVHGFEGVYTVSRCGRLRRIASRAGVRVGGVLNPSPNHKGYFQAVLCWDGKKSNKTIHSIVCEAFIGPRPDGHTINHKDGDKSNNRACNLEYVTSYQNYVHSVESGLSIRNKPKISVTQAREIKALKGSVPYAKVAEQFGLSERSVRDIWSGRNWKHA